MTSVPMPLYQTASHALTQEPVAPWSLTASDGSGLLLSRVDAKAVFQGPLAFTELHLYFHNLEDRVREGTFQIALPSRAAVSRFAMEIDGKLMEAEVVEKQLARRAYEDFLHRRQDPALLEKAAGNQFTARVFPIPARANKHLVISFSQELPGERYTLPLRGLPKIERVDVELTTFGPDGKSAKQTLSQRNWQPDKDFVSTAAIAAQAVSAGTQIAAQVEVKAAAGADEPGGMTLLFDTSASRTLGFASAVDALDRLIASVRDRYGAALPLQVVAFDQDTQAIYDGPASGWSAGNDAAKKALLARGAAGASDLGQAIAWLGAHAPKARLVVLTDGVVTAGDDQAAVEMAIKKLRGVERVDTVLAGGIRDEAFASAIARASARPGAVLDLEAGLANVTAGLGERVLVDVAIDVPGARWVYPRKIPSVRSGSLVMVYAETAAPQRSIDVSVDRTRRTIGLAAGTDALVQRALAAAHIAQLEGELATATGPAATTLRADIARRSVAARVVSSQTALLVLETDADYARFGIGRTALADILAIEGGVVVQKHRTLEMAMATAVKKPPVAKTDAKLARPEKALEKNKDSDKASGADAYDGRDDATGFKQEPPSAPGPMPPAPPPPPDRHHIGAGSGAPPMPRPERRDPRPAPDERRIAAPDAEMAARRRAAPEAWPPPGSPPPLRGELAGIIDALARRNVDAAYAKAKSWRDREPVNVLALIGMGEALEAKKDLATAARMYGSIIDLFPGRADLRRFAGERLERIGATARSLAIDTYRRAVADRPDHLTGHRLLAYALLRAGKHADAFAAVLAGLDRKYPDGRFRGGERVLSEDAGLIGAAYAAAAPGKRAEIEAALARRKSSLAVAPSTRFVLYWETDANDVDFHIQDARGGHASYSSKDLPSGGSLFEDVTTGYGPECFAIPGVAKAGPYRLSINYYSQGPMGYGMGLLQIVSHDGKGGLAIQDRPYVIMNDRAYVDLGSY